MKTDKHGARHLTEVLKQKKVRHIVICPGSRNAPLVASFTDDSYFNCYSIVDERSAGFFAMGISQVIKDTVAVVCTSGSALLNLAPAVAESFYQRIPLLVISADRPREWLNQGESQTFNQNEVFKNYVRRSFDLVQEPNSNDDLWYQDREVSEAVNSTRQPYFGPAHINIRFREPLYNFEKAEDTSVKIVNQLETVKSLTNESTRELQERLNSYKKVMLVCGSYLPGEAPQKDLDALAKRGLVVFTESTSNLSSDDFFPSIDKLIVPLNEDERKRLKPDLLITLGGTLISRKIKNYIREIGISEHWHVDPIDHYQNAYMNQTEAIEMHAHDFLPLLSDITITSDYKEEWQSISDRFDGRHKSYLNACDYSDLKVFEVLFDHIPDQVDLHIANSSAIRYVQLFNTSSYSNYCNRGTSGIEGSVSTAVGASNISERSTYLITGDLAMMYDSNGLWNNYLSQKLKIVVINNGGGGIFRIIPGPKKITDFETFIETKTDSNFRALAELHGLKYSSADSIESLKSELQSFVANEDGPAMLEVRTLSCENDEVLRNYFEYLSMDQ